MILDNLLRLISEAAAQQGAENDVTSGVKDPLNRLRLQLLMKSGRPGGLGILDRLTQQRLESEGLWRERR